MSNVSDEHRKYYERKNRCRKCHSKNLAEAVLKMVPVEKGKDFVDRTNKYFCNNCGHSGYIDELLP